MPNEVKEANLIPVMLLSNDPTELKVRTIELIYQSLATGQLAYMDGKDTETGDIVPLLVGLSPISDTKVEIYPIAKLLIEATDTATYLVPDGSGDYTQPDGDNSVDLGLSEFLPARDGEEGAGETEGIDEAPRVLN